jgi:hypothetical protein
MVYERCTSRDFRELMELLITCFRVGDPVHAEFEVLYPDLYREDSPYLKDILLVREDGRLVATAGAFPILLRVGSRQIVIRGVGGVATHPDFQGRSLMSGVMTELCRMIGEARPPFAWLGGLRWRYATFGWERAGNMLRLSLSAKNIHKRCCPAGGVVRELAPDALPWAELLQMRDGEWLRGDASLAECQLKYRRKDMRCLVWFHAGNKAVPRAFLALKGEQIVEWGGDATGADDLLRHVAAEMGGLTVAMPPLETPWLRAFRPAAEDFSLSTWSNYAVVDLAACLSLAAENPVLRGMTPPMAHGINLRITDHRYPWDESFFGLGPAGVEVGPVRPGTPELAVDSLTAAAMIFGPLAPSRLLGRPDLAWLDGPLPLLTNLPAHYHV